ncbi:MAG: sigma-54 dependent transcriptional regulator [Desulfobacterales bacterium]|nr:sigma-54 dependent transcriptional regulator [Desulfobacterales bacterium]
MKSKILIVDDDNSIRKGLALTLGDNYRVVTAANATEALDTYDRERPDIVLLDVGLPEMDGVAVLEKLKKIDAEAVVIMVTAVEDVKTIVKAVKGGAYDYLVKPVDSQDLLLTIQNALENRGLRNQIRSIQKPQVEKYTFDLIGQNPEVKAVIDIARKASASRDTPVLITGGSGVGKSVLAKATHYNSQGVPGPFVTVNCGAIAKDLVESELFGYTHGAFTGARAEGKKGRFEEAAGGTLFLDEIGAMPLSAQVKLLAVLEDRTFHRIGGSRQIDVDARIIAATNIDLEEAVALGEFRGDLFFRLNVVRIDLPALRDRREDIVLLAQHFMAQYNSKFNKHFDQIATDAQAFMRDYPWPGNIRELRNTIERIVLIENGEIITPEHFEKLGMRLDKPTAPIKPEPAEGELDYNEATKNLIRDALQTTKGNITEAARLMNIAPHKLRYRIKKYGLTPKRQ